MACVTYGPVSTQDQTADLSNQWHTTKDKGETDQLIHTWFQKVETQFPLNYI